MSATPRPLSDAFRERIAMVRVLCIGFMIYVHVPDNAISSVSDGVPLGSLLLQGFLTEGMGRASAALLSLVSGLLTALALVRGAANAGDGMFAGASSLYRRRFRSIVLPMIFWSVTTVAFYSLVSLVRPTFLYLDGRSPGEAVMYYLNVMFFLTEQPPLAPTLHLGFLRDLFVCVLLSPLLLALVRRIGVLLPLALGLYYLADLESVVILRPLVLFAFSIGVWLATSGARLDRLDRAWPLWVALSIVATLLVMVSSGHAVLDSAFARWLDTHGFDIRELVFYPLSRLFGALAIWALAAKLVGGAWNSRLTRLSPYVFVAFCSHSLVLTVLWDGLVLPLIGGTTSPFFAVWFLVAPVVAMLAAVLIVEVTARFAPALAALLTGGRVGPAAPRGNRPGTVPAEGLGGAFAAPTVRRPDGQVEGDGARSRATET